MHQEDPKKEFRCPHKFKMVKWWPQIRAHELQGVPRWVQGGPRWTQDGQEASRGPQAGPKWTHKGPKWNPSGDPNGKFGVDKNVKILLVFF